ncbi:MAG: DUF1947 domain-containing protein [Acidilobaceae archaeon]
MRPSRRHLLSKRESKAIVETFKQLIDEELKPEVIEVAIFQDFEIYIIDGKPALAKVSGEFVPLLSFLLSSKATTRIPTIYVDRGATIALSRGADLMAPGVRKVEGEFEAGAVVVVADEEKKAPIMVGKALVSSEELRKAVETKARGKVVINLHHVGDEIWKTSTLL